MFDLENELKKYQVEFDEITDSVFFRKFTLNSWMGTTFLYKLKETGDYNWQEVVVALQAIIATLVDFVRECIEGNQILWVQGI